MIDCHGHGSEDEIHSAGKDSAFPVNRGSLIAVEHVLTAARTAVLEVRIGGGFGKGDGCGALAVAFELHLRRTRFFGSHGHDFLRALFGGPRHVGLRDID